MPLLSSLCRLNITRQTVVMSNGQISTIHATLLDLVTASNSNSALIFRNLEHLRLMLAPCMHAIKDLSALHNHSVGEIQKSILDGTHDVNSRLARIEERVERNALQTETVLKATGFNCKTVEDDLNIISMSQMKSVETQGILVIPINQSNPISRDSQRQKDHGAQNIGAELTEKLFQMKESIDSTKLILLKNMTPLSLPLSVNNAILISSFHDPVIRKLTRSGFEALIKRSETIECLCNR